MYCSDYHIYGSFVSLKSLNASDLDVQYVIMQCLVYTQYFETNNFLVTQMLFHI